MTFRGIDRNRFTYLLSLGTDAVELRRFFADSRVQLIQRGAKVQNLPHGDKARIRVLAYELPQSTDEIVQGWFSKNLTMVDPEEAGATIELFKAHEEAEEALPEDSAQRLARSCLVHLFSKDPSRALLDFLQTPVGGEGDEQEDIVDADAEQRESTDIAQFSGNFAQVLVDLAEGRDADEHLEGLPLELATFVTGLQAIVQGPTKDARISIEALPMDSIFRGTLEQFLKQQEAAKASAESSPRGVHIISPETFEGSFDYERDEVLAYCTKADRASAVFVHPLAVVRGGRPLLLVDEMTRQIFPETGDLIAFSGPGRPRQPRRGEVGVWRVAEHQTERATHFHLGSEENSVYEVRLVPFPSTEYDSVREFLKEHGERAGGNILQPLLFQLGDGLIVGGRGERLDYTKDDTFESGLLAWNSLPALRLDGRLFVLGPLPKEQRVYECAGLASTVRKLFKAHIGAGKAAGGVTKAQLREIVQSIDSIDTNLDALRVQRIRSELERLGEQQVAFDALVTELMNHPNVMHRIDQDVKEEVTKQVEQKKDLQSDIARLLKERGEWEDRIRKQQTEHRKLREETSKVVKAAFEKARADGVATFAELAIFQALSTTTTAGPTISSQAHSGGPAMAAQPIARELPPNDQDLITLLRTYGVPGQRATALSEVSKAAMNAGLMVCVTGVASRLVVESWARTLGRTPVVFDATVGLIDTNTLTSLLGRTPSYDVLALLDANLSALDIYARQLSDLVLSRVARPDGEPQIAILLALGDGVGSLPLPKTFECVSITIDLEKQYEFPGASSLDELMAAVNDPEEGILQKRLWRPAADRLRLQIEKLDPEARVRVLAVLATR